MKIIRKGLLDEEGIFINCQYCKAQFLIERREDLSVNFDYDFYEQKYCANYSVHCPSCHDLIWLGYIDDEKFTHQYSCLKDRKDWVERYKVEEERI